MEGANWNTEERFITHPAQFPVRLFLIGLQVSDLVMQSVIFFLYALEFLFLFFWLAFYLAFRWRKVLYAVIMYEKVCQNAPLLSFTHKAPTFTSWGFVIT